jgi:hypothetical protein
MNLEKPGVSVYLACRPTVMVEGEVDDNMEDEDGPVWECCCTFSLTVCNAQQLRRDVTWHSNLTDDRFHSQCREWGVHRLVSLRRLRDESLGFLRNDTLTVQVRLKCVKPARPCHARGAWVVTGSDSERGKAWGILGPRDCLTGVCACVVAGWCT